MASGRSSCAEPLLCLCFHHTSNLFGSERIDWMFSRGIPFAHIFLCHFCHCFFSMSLFIVCAPRATALVPGGVRVGPYNGTNPTNTPPPTQQQAVTINPERTPYTCILSPLLLIISAVSSRSRTSRQLCISRYPLCLHRSHSSFGLWFGLAKVM